MSLITFVNGGIAVNENQLRSLKELAGQLEGEICKELRPANKYYQLLIFATSDHESSFSCYPVPDPKTALIVIDIILEEFTRIGYTECMFCLQYRNDLDEPWRNWHDGKGNSVCDFVINENFVMIAP